jgi:LPS O-antigen subunit length determinant protein (WzzB/FepE family)
MSSRQEQFLEVYRLARVEDQRGYHERAAEKAEAAHRQLLLITAIVFGVAGAVAVLAGLDISGKLVWAVLAAVLPATTTVLSAYNGLYAFERVTKLSRDAARNLRRVQPPQIAHTDAQASVSDYVADVERILEKERGQWGQLAVEPQAKQEGG